MHRRDASDAGRVYLLDTTLRDGDQAPGMAMSPQEKLAVARRLAAVGVDVIEAGFPAASAAEAEAVRIVAAEVRGATIAALPRARAADLEAAVRALRFAPQRLIHVTCPTSPIHRQYQLQMAPDDLLALVEGIVRDARSSGAMVEVGAEDATRTEPRFLCELFDAVVEAGAAVVNVADTLGCALPSEFARLVMRVVQDVPGVACGRARVSVHCHDDLGLAVANTLAGIGAGARQAEVTLLGIGERAGNAALETVALALTARPSAFAVSPCQVRFDALDDAARLLAAITGLATPPGKPLLGGNAFAHSAGIHQHGLLRRRGTYDWLPPTARTRRPTRFVVSRHSGAAGVRACLERLASRALPDAVVVKVAEQIATRADRQRMVGPTELLTLLREAGVGRGPACALVSVETSAQVGPHGEEHRVVVRLRLADGRHVRRAARGASSIAALLRVLEGAAGVPSKVVAYGLQAAGDGRHSGTRVSLRLSLAGRETIGEARDGDVAAAFARAWVEAVNEALAVTAGLELVAAGEEREPSMGRSCAVRQATSEDVGAMLELLAQLFGIEQDFRIDHQRQAAALRLLLADPQQRCVLVAESGPTVVGMVTGQLVVSTAAGGLSLLVEDLAVDERHRRQGIGHRLIEALEGWGRQHGALRLQLVADETNAVALHFYENQRWRRSRMVALYKGNL